MLSLTRRYQFSSAHRLWNPDLSKAENEKHFGPCIRLHGHNYILEVTVSGKPDPVTGMIYSIVVLDSLIQTEIISQVDHYNLDEDVVFLKGVLSTAENLSAIFYQKLVPKIPVTLERVRLYENETSWAEFNKAEDV